MELQVTSLDGNLEDKVSLDAEVFGLEPRSDLLQRMVRYQLLKRQAGTHAVKNRSDVVGTTKKFVRQKGSGGARHGSRKANIFRGGGRAFGPTPRSHAVAMPKKVRALALKHALSAKLKSGDLIVLDKAEAKEAKTSALRSALSKIKLSNALIIGGSELNKNFAMAARNIPLIDVLPVQGINVYDILRRAKLVLTRDALSALEARFK